MKSPTAYLPNLTPLRGLAALFTVVFHLNIGSQALLSSKASLVIDKMYLMVDFFFVFSGFILMHVYAERFQGSVTGNGFKRFGIARFARVYPLHLFTLLYLVGLRVWFLSAGGTDNPWWAVSYRWDAIATNLLLVQAMNIHDWFSWNNAAWSISTEWWMYMLFPFLVKPFFRLNAAGRVAVMLACFAGYVGIMFLIQPIVRFAEPMAFVKPLVASSLNVAYDWGFLRCAFGFVIGTMMYLGYKDGWAKSFFGNGTVFVLLALGMFACLHFGVPDVCTVAFFPFLLLSAAYGSPRMDAFFGTKPLQRIGDWSFSIYLVHQPILYTIEMVTAYLNPPKPGAAPAGPPPEPDRLMGWLTALAFIAITLLLSFLTYRFIEVPARNWINKRFDTRRKLIEAA